MTARVALLIPCLYLVLPIKAEQTDQIVYFLPKTQIQINAIVQRRTDKDGAIKSRSIRADFSLVATSDITQTYQIDPSVPALSNTKTVLNLTPDGRLSSIDSTSQGQAATLVKSIFRGMATIIGLGGQGVRFRGSVNAMAERYKADHPKMSKRREEYINTEQSLALQLAKISLNVADTSGDELDALQSKVAAVKKTLATVREELALADNHFAAWRDSQTSVVDVKITEYVDIDSLPVDDDIEKLANGEANPSEEALHDALEDYLPVFERIGFIITRSGATPASPNMGYANAPNPRDARGIAYRVAYPTTFCLYNTAPPVQTKPVLVACKRENVLGPSSPIVNLSLKSKAFGQRRLIVQFNDSGSIKSISNDSKSAVADVSALVQGVPTEILAALQQANKILDANRALAVQSLENQIEKTKAEQSLLTQQIALYDTIAASATDAKLNELNRKLALLEAQRNVVVAATAPDSTIVSLETNQRLLELENALREAEVRRLQLERQIDELRVAIDRD